MTIVVGDSVQGLKEAIIRLAMDRKVEDPEILAQACLEVAGLTLGKLDREQPIGTAARMDQASRVLGRSLAIGGGAGFEQFIDLPPGMRRGGL